jgi:hypothetical protein
VINEFLYADRSQGFVARPLSLTGRIRIATYLRKTRWPGHQPLSHVDMIAMKQVGKKGKSYLTERKGGC